MDIFCCSDSILNWCSEVTSISTFSMYAIALHGYRKHWFCIHANIEYQICSAKYQLTCNVERPQEPIESCFKSKKSLTHKRFPYVSLGLQNFLSRTYQIK